jgi:hypothetical protein
MKRKVIRIGGAVAIFYAVMGVVALALRRLRPSTGDEQSDEVRLEAVMRGIKIESHARAFRGGSARAIMGGIELDLRDATLDPAGARLEMRVVMAGIEIIIPNGWRVVTARSRAFAGGIEAPGDAGAGQSQVPIHEGVEAPRETGAAGGADERPTLTIDCRAIFGGIQVSERAAEREAVAR